MPAASPTALAYRSELNGLRAVAVGVVVLHHWLHPPFPLGEIGRCLFFVLSGYLVSGIVWKYGVYWGAPGRWWRRMGTFYIRRVLRIMPPYYLALAGCALLPLAAVREHPWWFLLPGANLLFYRSQGWFDGVGHYWTLAVDEQFYLLWPLLLALLGRRLMPFLVLAATGWLFRVGWFAWSGSGMIHLLLPANFDLFALGSVLRLEQGRRWLGRVAQGKYVALAWLSWILLHLLLDSGPWAVAWANTHITWLAVTAFLTIGWLLEVPGAGRRLGLLHPIAQWVGQRSFGFYLYHLPLLVGWQRLVYHFVPGAAGRATFMGPLPVLLVLLPVLTLVSAASWHFVEAHMDQLKNRFQYTASTKELTHVI